MEKNFGRYQLHLCMHGRFDEALSEVKRASELDPLSRIINANLGNVYSFARHYDLAIEQLRNTLEMYPDFIPAHYFLGRAYIFKGEIANGVEQLQQAIRLANDDPRLLAVLGYAHGISGNREEAGRTLVRLEELSATRDVSAYDYATVYAGLGDRKKAVEFLEQCLEQAEWRRLIFLKVDPFWDNLRDDPRFVELLKKVGLDE